MPFVKTHQPCDNCGSSDALSYDDEGGSHCFSCGQTIQGNTTADVINLKDAADGTVLEERGGYSALEDRGITGTTAKRYDVTQKEGNTLFSYYNEDGERVAAKRRTPDKDFRTSGAWSSAGLFGQQAFRSGGLAITITEGEFDAMSVHQMFGSKYPAVSIKNGANNALKDCVAAYDYLDSFDKIYICFDSDKFGKAAAQQVADLFSGKSYVVSLGEYKDANEMLQAGKSAEFVKAWWAAKLYTPDGIIDGSSLWEDVSQDLAKADLEYPFTDLNKITYGIRKGELVTVTAGSGLGKSQFVREIVYHTLMNTEDSVGLMFLEEGVRKTGLSLMSLHTNKPMHLPGTETTETEKKEAFDATLGTGRVHMFNHFGSTGIDNILARIRFMVKGLGCKYIFLDHISIIVSAQGQDDERKAIDEIMTKLRMMVEETGIALFVVSHLRRPQGAGHEDGASTSLSQLRGSAAIAQLSDMVIGLERNGQADDEVDRNTTSVRVLKNRFSGETGPAGSLYFNKETGRMQTRDVTLTSGLGEIQIL